MNSLKILSVLIGVTLIAGCSASDSIDEGRRSNIDMAEVMIKVNEVRKSAINEVDFYDMKDNNERYVGAFVELRGYIVDTINQKFLFYADPYFDDNYGFFSVFIDNPLPNQTRPGEPLRYLTIGDRIALVAEITGLDNYPLKKRTIWIPVRNYHLSVKGEEFRKIPFLEAIAIIKDDAEYQSRFPEWVSKRIEPDYTR
jgi:hypothetical protein